MNPENPVSDLDIDTIAKIYTGEITNWKDVGGNDAEIVLIGREAGSGTRDGFESITDTKDACQYRQELTSTATVKDGSYVVQRPFVLVTKEGTKLSPAAQAFFDYALSADAASIIAAAGAVAAN